LQQLIPATAKVQACRQQTARDSKHLTEISSAVDATQPGSYRELHWEQ
jgi:hypothetical protein